MWRVCLFDLSVLRLPLSDIREEIGVRCFCFFDVHGFFHFLVIVKGKKSLFVSVFSSRSSHRAHFLVAGVDLGLWLPGWCGSLTHAPFWGFSGECLFASQATESPSERLSLTGGFRRMTVG